MLNREHTNLKNIITTVKSINIVKKGKILKKFLKSEYKTLTLNNAILYRDMVYWESDNSNSGYKHIVIRKDERDYFFISAACNNFLTGKKMYKKIYIDEKKEYSKALAEAMEFLETNLNIRKLITFNYKKGYKYLLSLGFNNDSNLYKVIINNHKYIIKAPTVFQAETIAYKEFSKVDETSNITYNTVRIGTPIKRKGIEIIMQTTI